MGVNQLWSILEPVKRKQSLSALSDKTLCVDLSGWICEAQCAKGLKDNVNKPHLRNLFFRLLHLTRLGVRLVFVVDGKAPELKWQAITKRIQARNGGHVSKNPRSAASSARVGRSHFAAWVKECCTFLGLLGFPCIESSGEAEALCAWLDQQNIVDGCITNDGDAFLYGAQTVYRDICISGKDASVQCYKMDEIEAKLDLNREKLVALAILLGCDYLPQGVPGVGKEIGMKLIRAVDCENVIDRLHAWRKGTLLEESLSTVENLVKSKALKDKNFPHPKVIEEFLAPNIVTRKVSLRIASPYLKGLQEFCLKNLDWPEEYTRAKVLPLVTYWQMTSFLKCNSDLLVRPERIVKARIQQRVECYEVEWQNIKVGETCPNHFTTIETRELFAKVYPEAVKEFSNMEALRTRKSRMKKTQPNDDDKDVDLLTKHLEELTFTGSSEQSNNSVVQITLCSSPPEASLNDETLQDIMNTVLPASSESHFQQSHKSLAASRATWDCHANTASDDDNDGANGHDDCCTVMMHSKVKTVFFDPILHDVFESSDEDDNPQNQSEGLANLVKPSSMSKAKVPFGNENAINGVSVGDRQDIQEPFFTCASKSGKYPGLLEMRTVICSAKPKDDLKSNDNAIDYSKANLCKRSDNLTYSSASSGLRAFYSHRRGGDVFESSCDHEHSSSDSLKAAWSLAPSEVSSFASSSDVNNVVDLCPKTHCNSNYGSIFEGAANTAITQLQKAISDIKTSESSNGDVKSTRNVLQPKSGSMNSNTFSSQSKSVEYHDVKKYNADHLERIQTPGCTKGLHEQLSIKENLQVVSPSHDYLSVPLSKRLERQLSNRKRLLPLQSISSGKLVDD